MRDDRNDSINVTVWGNIEYVNPLATICRIGKQGSDTFLYCQTHFYLSYHNIPLFDTVIITNARVKLLEEKDEYRPSISR